MEIISQKKKRGLKWTYIFTLHTDIITEYKIKPIKIANSKPVNNSHPNSSF